MTTENRAAPIKEENAGARPKETKALRVTLVGAVIPVVRSLADGSLYRSSKSGQNDPILPRIDGADSDNRFTHQSTANRIRCELAGPRWSRVSRAGNVAITWGFAVDLASFGAVCAFGGAEPTHCLPRSLP